MAEKKGILDFLKNKNVKKLEKSGKDRYGRDPDEIKEKKAQGKFEKIKALFKK